MLQTKTNRFGANETVNISGVVLISGSEDTRDEPPNTLLSNKCANISAKPRASDGEESNNIREPSCPPVVVRYHQHENMISDTAHQIFDFWIRSSLHQHQRNVVFVSLASEMNWGVPFLQ